MHRIEGLNNIEDINGNKIFTDGPPATTLPAVFMNALQEEIANVIETAGLALKSAGSDTKTQLRDALALDFITAGEDPLYVDKVNDRVGIMDSTPSYELDVNGDVRITGSLITQVSWIRAAQIGNDLNIAGVSDLALAALNGTDVAFIDSGNNDLRVYRFDGTNWAQIGNDLNIAGVGFPALAALNGTDVAFIDSTNIDLRVYRFDGTNCTRVSSVKRNRCGIY